MGGLIRVSVTPKGRMASQRVVAFVAKDGFEKDGLE